MTAVLLTEFGDFAMLRRMLRGIKALVESSRHDRRTKGGNDG
jgi:hypothetical protein